MAVADNNPSPFWGEVTLNTGERAEGQLGTLRFVLTRDAQSWQIHWFHAGENQCQDIWLKRADGAQDADSPFTVKPPDDIKVEVRRFCQNPQAKLHLAPCLAPRPVVIKPPNPLSLSGNANLDFFVTSPIWLRLCDGSGKDANNFLELPSVKQSDTWFGADTLDGELCFASKTVLRLNDPQDEHLLCRAITQVSVRNNVGDILSLDKFKLPAPQLFLFRSGEQHYTNRIKLLRDGDASTVEMRISDSAPAGMSRAGRARLPFNENRIIDIARLFA